MKLTKCIMTKEVVNEIVELFERLNNLTRWPSFTGDRRYNQLNKLALENVICYMIAEEQRHHGIAIDLREFPKIALRKAFKRSLAANIPRSLEEWICKHPEIDIEKNDFYRATADYVCGIDKEFADFLFKNVKTGIEAQIYSFASELASYIELLSLKNQTNREDLFMMEIKNKIDKIHQFTYLYGYDRFSNLESPEFKLWQEIAYLRNQSRWMLYSRAVECSVLGHLFDTGVIAYTMTLEENPKDEELAAKMFFMGLFHDIAETWTTDIPSPYKELVRGLREASERYESEMIKKNIYDIFPDYMAKAIKAVMFEEPQNEGYFRLVKGADYMSADTECLRNYNSGTCDYHFYNAVSSNSQKIESGYLKVSPIWREKHLEILKKMETIKKGLKDC